MDTLKKFKLSIWKKLVEKYYSGGNISYVSMDDFTFPPSRQLLHYLMRTFTETTLERFENGPDFSAYQVSFSRGNVYGHAIYKTTAAIYPAFCSYSSIEEYQRSFDREER